MTFRAVICAVLHVAVTAGFAVAGVPIAAADPSGFPDLSGLTDVTSSHQLRAPHDPSTVDGFVFTADGYTCSGGATMVSCGGVLPGMTGVPVSVGYETGPCEVDYVSGESDLARMQRGRDACRGPATNPVLSPGQKVTYGPSVCGVLAGGVTACTNGVHGFVLQPSGSWSF